MPIERFDLTGGPVPADTVQVGRLQMQQASDVEMPVAEQASMLDVTAAALRKHNSLASILEARSNGMFSAYKPEEGFDPLDEIEGTEFSDTPEMALRFADATSRAEVNAIKQQIKSEWDSDKAIQSRGAVGTAVSIAAAITDPVSILAMALPGAQTRAGSRAVGFFKGAGATMAAETALEGIFQATQQARSIEESALNVGAATILGGFLGGLTAKIPEDQLARLQTNLSNDLNGPTPGATSVGAMRTGAQATLEQNTIARGGLTIARTLGKVNPVLRGMTSESAAMRNITENLVETTVRLEKNNQGIATADAVETSLKRTMGSWWTAYKARHQLFNQYRAEQKAQGLKYMSRAEFSEAVSAAMRRNDEHAIPQVAQAAKITRQVVFNPPFERAKRLGLFAEDAEKLVGAPSYLMRMYNVRRIKQDKVTWLRTLEDSFTAQGVDRAEAATIAQEVTRRITGSEMGMIDARVMDGIVPKSGRAKGRTLDLPDTVLEPWLVNDIDELSQSYIRTFSPEIEITERFGTRDMADQIQEIVDEYAGKRKAAQDAGDNKRIAEIDKAEKRDLEDIQAMRDRLYGTYGAPKDPAAFAIRVGRFLRAWNYTRLLGGQTISSISDLGSVMMKFGGGKLLSSSMRLAKDIEAMKLSSEFAKRIGAALDLTLNSRGVALGDLHQYSSFAEQRIMNKAANAFSIASGMAPWNAIMKSVSSVMSQDDILLAAQRVASGKKLSKNETARFAQVGIDSDAMKRIADQYKKHGRKQGGLHFGLSENWDDIATRDLFENAILREADSAVPTPGAGDLPLFMSTETGKLMLQFKSFAMAGVTRITIPMAQGIAHGDHKALIALPVMFGMGGAVYALKQIAAGRPITDDPAEFAAEAVDWSGMLGWGAEVLTPAASWSGFVPGSRFQSRDQMETFLGPSMGTGVSLLEATRPGNLADGIDQKELHRIRKLLPGQNLFYIRRALDAIEEGLVE